MEGTSRKRSRTQDVPEQSPMKKTCSFSTACKVRHISDAGTNQKDASKSKSKPGKRKRQSDTEDSDDGGQPTLKNFKNCWGLFEENSSELEVATSSTKEACKSPQELIQDIEIYLPEFYTDVKNIDTNFTNDSRKLADMFRSTTRDELVESENVIMKDIKPAGVIIDVKLKCEPEVLIHTVYFEASKENQEKKLPLVLIHGFGGGFPVFYNNFSDLSTNRKVYAIDLPGFALSSRVKFSNKPEECRKEFVKFLEMWREVMDLDKFILLGHSFGGYISASYAVEHSDRVKHLILADSWGIIKKCDEKKSRSKLSRFKVWLRINPFQVVRNTLQLGRVLYEKCIPESTRKAYGDKLVRYFYHCNAQKDPTGEAAFICISHKYLWPRTPMKPDLEKLDSKVSITFLYGENSPYNNDGGHDVRRNRDNVFVHKPIAKAGHHIQAETSSVFNEIVIRVCNKVDSGTDKCGKGE